MPLAIVFPGQGSQSVGMMKGFADAARRDDVPRGPRDLRRGLLGDGRARDRPSAEPDREHAAADARGRRRLLARVARAGRPDARPGSRGTAWASTPRSWRRSRCASRTRCRWCACARRRCRRRSPRAPAASPRSWASTTRSSPRRAAPTPRRARWSSRPTSIPRGRWSSRVTAPRSSAAMALAKERGAKRAVMLPMSAPSHCSLMKPAAERLRERARGDRRARSPPCPWCTTATSAALRRSRERIRAALVEQLDHPVRWIETVQFLAGQGREAHRRVRAGQGAHGAVQAHRSPASNASPSRIRPRSTRPSREARTMLNGQVAIVTGASRGIGEGILQALAKAGRHGGRHVDHRTRARRASRRRSRTLGAQGRGPRARRARCRAVRGPRRARCRRSSGPWRSS